MRIPFYNDLGLQESWELEAMVANYLMKQLRAVGYGLSMEGILVMTVV